MKRKLNEQQEFEIMKLHTVHGARLFLDKQSEFDEAAGIVALNHHERWDGKGYPLGLTGKSIPKIARILLIIDKKRIRC